MGGTLVRSPGKGKGKGKKFILAVKMEIKHPVGDHLAVSFRHL